MTKDQESLVSSLIRKDPYGFFIAIETAYGFEIACRMADTIIEIVRVEKNSNVSELNAAAELYLASQEEFPECGFCDYRVFPNSPHDFCDEQMKLLLVEEWDDAVDEAVEEGAFDDRDDEDEDPLEGDVEPTGGFYYAPDAMVGGLSAHSLDVMRQHGDYTG